MQRLKTYQDSIIFAVTNQEFLLEQMDQVLELRDGSYTFGTYEEIRANSGREVRT